jgi:hypothetical protein
MSKLSPTLTVLGVIGVMIIASIILYNAKDIFVVSTPSGIHPITMDGATDYEVLIENLGDQVRVTEELNALQSRKIQKLQQQIEILDDAGLRACNYLQRISTDLTLVQQGLKAASLKELDLEKVREALNTLRTNVTEAGQDVNTIFLSSPVYHVPVKRVPAEKATE